MSDNYRDRGPFCVALQGTPQDFSESDALEALKEFEPLHAKALTDGRWIVSLKTKKNAEDAHHIQQRQFSSEHHEFTFFISACEKNDIPVEWIQTKKEDDAVGDYSVQPNAFSVPFTTGKPAVQQSEYQRNQVNMQQQNSCNSAFQQQISGFPQPDMNSLGMPIRSPQRNRVDDGGSSNNQATMFQGDGQMSDFRIGMPSVQPNAFSVPYTTGIPAVQQSEYQRNQVNMQQQNSCNSAFQQQISGFPQPDMNSLGMPIRSPQRNRVDDGGSSNNQATMFQGDGQMSDFRIGMPSVQPNAFSVPFTTGIPAVQQSEYQRNQVNMQQQNSCNSAFQQQISGFPQPDMNSLGMPIRSPQRNRVDDGGSSNNQATMFQGDGQMSDFRIGMPSVQPNAFSVPFTTGIPAVQQSEYQRNQVNMQQQNSCNSAFQQQISGFPQPDMNSLGMPIRSPQRNHMHQFWHDTYRGFQPNTYIGPVTRCRLVGNRHQSPYQSGQFYRQYSELGHPHFPPHEIPPNFVPYHGSPYWPCDSDCSPYDQAFFMDQPQNPNAPLPRKKVSSRDDFEFLLERVSHDGDIKDLIYPDSSTAVIKFKDPLDRVLQKQLTNQEREAYPRAGKNVKLVDNRDEKDGEPKTTVEVTGFPKDLTKDIFEMYFGNVRQSGGGPIRNMQLQEEICLITFESETATNAVLERSHKLGAMELVVKLYKPVAMYEDRLLISGLHEKIPEEYLNLFLDRGGEVSPKELLYSEKDERNVLVIFDGKPDLQQLKKYCQEKTLEGAKLEVSQVPKSRCILVTSHVPNPSKSMMKMHFGGKSVEKVDIMEDGANLVYFEEEDAVDFVMRQHHKLGNPQLQVQLFYPCIGRTTTAENRKFKNPEPFVYKSSLHIICFFKQIPTAKAWLEQEMSEVHGRPMVPSDNSDKIEVFSMLTSDMEGVKRLGKTWKETAEQKLEESIKQVNCVEHQVVPDIWGNTIAAFDKMEISNEKDVIVSRDHEHSVIRVVGFKGMVENISNNLKRIIDDEETKLEIKKQRIVDRRQLSKREIYFLSSVNFPDNVHKKCSNVKCTIQQEDMIVFEGTITDVKQAELLMDEILKSVKKASLPDYSRNKLQLLSMKETDDYVRQKLKERDCLGIWQIHDGHLIVWDRSDMKVKDSIQIIRNCLVEKSLEITPAQQSVLNSDLWTEKFADIRTQYQGYLAINEDTQNATIEIAAISQYADEIINIVKDFLQANEPYKKTIAVDSWKVKYIEQWKTLDISNICKRLQKKVTIHFKVDAFEIQGTLVGVNEAEGRLLKLLERVVYKKKTFNMPGTCKYICSDKGMETIKCIEEENKCSISIIDEDDNTNQALVGESWLELKKHMKHPVEHLSFRLPGGQNIFVIHGDITDLDAEMLVIACNKFLHHSAGLAKKIAEKGGDVIKKECLKHANRPLMEGEVVYISGGKLKCKIVAHAVSPVCQGGTNNDESLLKKVIIKSLEETDYRKFISIGIPAIGTEVFGYPVSEAAQIIVRTVKSYFEGKKLSSVKNVFLCDLKSHHVRAFIEAVNMFFPQSALSINQDPSQAAAQASMGSSSARFGTLISSIHRIEVVKGEMNHQKSAVLVNTTSPDLNLTKGAVSAALLKAAGEQLQTECTKKYPNGIKYGEVAVTGPGNLQCCYVFHGSLPSWNKDGSSLAIMNAFMINCLNEANRLKTKSVAFPALGTGILQYPKDVVAREMFNSISNFLTKNPQTSLETVYLVVYGKDLTTLEAFQKEQEFRKFSCTSPTSYLGNPDSQKKIEQGRQNESDGASRLSKNGQFPEYIPEVIVKQGDITEVNVDAIVNPCNSDLSLGGKDLRKKGIVITPGYKLPCKWIMHVNIHGQPQGWKGVFMKCFENAAHMKLRSIAFPALGTGPKENASPEEIGKALYSAMCEAGSSTLKDVKMVVFQQQMVLKIEAGVMAAKMPTEKSPGILKNITSFICRGKGIPSLQPSDPVDETRVIVAICADLEENIDVSFHYLESKCKTEMKTEQMMDDAITRMSTHQVSAIEKLGRRQCVMVSTDIRNGHIRLEGLHNDVAIVKSEVYKLVIEVGKVKEAEMLFNLVQWYWIEITPDEQKLMPYNKDLNVKIEEAYNRKDKTVRFIHDNVTYIINLEDLEEYPEDSASVPSSKVKVLRKDKLNDTVSRCIPDHWDAMNTEHLRIVNLPSKSPEYAKVSSCFMANINKEKKEVRFSIVKIERIQNKILYAQYHTRKKHMEEKNPGIQNEMPLWHGTNKDAIDSINEHGFNRSFCGTANAKQYGDGVYFARESYYSARDAYSQPDPAGNKRMYLTRVLTGRYTKGKQRMRVPPHVTVGQQELYDSVVDNEMHPGIFVIFHDTQAYPEYLITFRCN